MKYIDRLFEGPLDIVGDVHGEIDALNDLLAHLGYAEDGTHADGRRLVFLGDLTDRGPDSPAVLKKVMALVDAGCAQCILGNHELNLLRDEEKHGNSWWANPAKYNEHPAEIVRADDKVRMMRFLERLPIALERADLRVVHACWNAAAIAELRARESEGLTVVALFQEYLDSILSQWKGGPIAAAYAKEWREHHLHLSDPEWAPIYLPAKAQMDREYQMSNPVCISTSGEEHETAAPFWAGGKWRMVDRFRWWENYDEQIPVIIGHYWRRFSEARTVFSDKFGPDLFAGVEPHHWMGKSQNVYCVDFSVGGRYAQRAADEPEHLCSLAAVRVPEWEVLHDDGTHRTLVSDTKN
jgi:hypothetical protein